MWSIILAILLSLVGFLLMFIILLQRGRGGGLAGAFGGMGGQSAFGTKAGDVFTKITVGMAVAWVVLAGVTGIVMFNESTGRFKGSPQKLEITVPPGEDESAGAADDSNTDSAKTDTGKTDTDTGKSDATGKKPDTTDKKSDTDTGKSGENK